MAKETLVVDCPQCGVLVRAEISSYIIDADSNPNEPPGAVFLVACPSCNNAILASSCQYPDDFNNWVWEKGERLWPHVQGVELSNSIPEGIRKDIEHAMKCLKQRIYSATAVLCGRALERIIVSRTNEKTIAKGLKKLRDDGVIDQKLFNWAEALRHERNIGAHASEVETTHENAQDVVDFTVAICDYIYTLNDKYESYVRRRSVAPQSTANGEPKDGQ